MKYMNKTPDGVMSEFRSPFHIYEPKGLTRGSSEYGENIVNQINEDYDSTLGKFLGENRTKLEIGEVLISSFFETTPAVYEARIVVDNIEEFNLLAITNFNELF